MFASGDIWFEFKPFHLYLLWVKVWVFMYLWKGLFFFELPDLVITDREKVYKQVVKISCYVLWWSVVYSSKCTEFNSVQLFIQQQVFCIFWDNGWMSNSPFYIFWDKSWMSNSLIYIVFLLSLHIGSLGWNLKGKLLIHLGFSNW